ncbi:MAG: hypothetical protein HQL63_08105, partial [Magnetococcales bacterium]|nr:hypothetical protein [Magnetococcales bacterium]
NNLDWLVVAMQGALPGPDDQTICPRPAPDSMLLYLEDLDDQGNRPTDLSGLHRYAGHPPWVMAA